MCADIRPFQDEDREAIIAGRNKTRPAHHQRSVAQWRRMDADRAAGEVLLRLCAGTPATAYLFAEDRSTSARRKPGVCGFDLWIAPEQWSEAFAEALYDKAEEFSRSRNAKRLSTYLTLYAPDDLMVPFLTQRGFTEVDRMVPVMLDLTAFDRDKFPEPAPAGIRFFSYAEAGDTDENRRRLYTLAKTLDRDAPTNDVHSEPPPFEEFVKHFDRPEWNNDALILAANNSGEWIGASQLRFQEGTNIAWTFLTVVLPEYRDQGIALALKLRTIDAAIARDCPLITTENHEDNAPMRAINRKLGFVPDAPQISYSKDLM
jgi:GNAT superfamily N-acetyltransferase